MHRVFEEVGEGQAAVAAKPFIDLLLTVRRDLRTAKQYALADQIRDELERLGIVVEDRPDGPIWRTSRPGSS